MSLGPILVSNENPIIGPLRVAPIDYPDGVNGTFSDPSWTTNGKDYVAFINTAGSANVGFTKTSPFWSFHPNLPPDNSDKLINLEYWNCGKKEMEVESPVDPLTGNPARVQCVDGNGFLYQLWGREKTLEGYTGVNYTIIRRIKLDGTAVDAVIDWQDIMPAWTLPTGFVVDPYDLNEPYGNHQFGTTYLYGLLSQTDGVLVQGLVYVRDPLSTPVAGADHFRYMWVHVDEDGNVGTPWWEPKVFVFGFGDLVARAYAPLGSGYLGVRDNVFGFNRFFTVTAAGVGSVSSALPGNAPGTTSAAGAISSSVLGSPSQLEPFHSDGSIWIGSQSAGRYLVSTAGTDLTPGWMAAANAKIYEMVVTAAPPSSDNFRMVTIEFDAGSWHYRVRDRNGNIVVESKCNIALGMDDAYHAVRVQDDCFMFRREGPPFGPYDAANYGIYKYRADNFVCVPVAQNRTACWPRGEFPHLDYSDWPTT